MKGLYLVAGYPSFEAFDAAVKMMESLGFDFLEVGIPFSDPVADGPLLARAAKRALESGVTYERALEWISSYRGSLRIYVMTYANILWARGLKNASLEMKNAGVKGVIVADLSNRERWFFKERGFELPIIPFATPESRPCDLEALNREDADFIYFISTRGTTGSGFLDEDALEKLNHLKSSSRSPVVLGFGISEAKHAARALEVADGFVVGTRAVMELEMGLESFESWCRSLAEL